MSNPDSNIFIIKAPIERVYEKFSDFRNLKSYFLNNQNFTLCTEDELCFSMEGLGPVSLKIKEKKLNSLVRVQSSENFPVTCSFIFKLEKVDTDTQVKINIELSGNMLVASFLKGNISNFTNSLIEKIKSTRFEIEKQ